MSGGQFEGDNTEPAYTMLFTSTDGGATLEGPAAVAKSPLGKHVQDGGLWIDPKGRLWWYYYAHGGMVANIAEDPEGAHPQFQSPFYVSRGFFINKPTVLADGSWLWTPADKEPSLGFKGVAVYRSQNEGRSFDFLGDVNSQPDAEINIGESMTVQLRDGRIGIFIRTLSGIRKTISDDGGRTWAKLEPLLGLGAVVNSRFFVRRLKSGNLLLVYNRPPEQPDPLASGPLADLRQLRERVHMTAVLSEDDGVTWKGGLRLDDRDNPSYSSDESVHRRFEKLSTYPDGTETADGSIWITYDLGRYGADGREIVLARIREQDVLAGKVVSPESRLKIRVHKLTTPRPDYIPINPQNPNDPDSLKPRKDPK